MIWLLQGVTITFAIVELMTKNLISGTVHLFYGIIMSALIGFGLDLGTVVFGHSMGISKTVAMQATACTPDRGLAPGW